MPVILEVISDPSPSDLEDLIKLYQDYPETLTSDDLGEWIKTKLAGGQTLFAGRFNGRLLCAIWGTPSLHSWQLDYLCVRAATRRRGVARQLLTLLARHAQQEKQELKIENQKITTELKALLSDIGFSCDASARQIEGIMWTIEAGS